MSLHFGYVVYVVKKRVTFFAFPSAICECSHPLHLPTPETHTHGFNMQSRQVSGEGVTKINMAGVTVHSQRVLLTLMFLVVGSLTMMSGFYTLQLYIVSYSTLFVKIHRAVFYFWSGIMLHLMLSFLIGSRSVLIL